MKKMSEPWGLDWRCRCLLIKFTKAVKLINPMSYMALLKKQLSQHSADWLRMVAPPQSLSTLEMLAPLVNFNHVIK